MHESCVTLCFGRYAWNALLVIWAGGCIGLMRVGLVKLGLLKVGLLQAVTDFGGPLTEGVWLMC